MLKSIRSRTVVSLLSFAMLASAGVAFSRAASAQGAKGQPIKIGVLVSRTGHLASFGADAMPGAEIFVEELNAKGGINGRPIQLVVIDDESKAEVLVTGAKRLIQQEKVVAILGPVSSAISLSLTPVVNEAKVPILNCGCRQGPITRYEFTTFPMKGYTSPMTRFAKEQKIGEVAILSVAGSLAEQMKRDSVPEIEAAGIKVAAFEQFQATDTDLTPILARLRSKGIKIVFGAASGAGAAVAAKNFKQLNYPGYYWTFPGNGNEAFINLVGDAADVVQLGSTKILVYDQLPDNDPLKARLTDFAKRYQAKTGKSAGMVAAFFYDGMLSLAEAVRVGGEDREKVRDALENQRNLRLLNGVLNRSASEHNGVDPDWVSLYVDRPNKRFSLTKK